MVRTASSAAAMPATGREPTPMTIPAPRAGEPLVRRASRWPEGRPRVAPMISRETRNCRRAHRPYRLPGGRCRSIPAGRGVEARVVRLRANFSPAAQEHASPAPATPIVHRAPARRRLTEATREPGLPVMPSAATISASDPMPQTPSPLHGSCPGTPRWVRVHVRKAFPEGYSGPGRTVNVCGLCRRAPREGPSAGAGRAATAPGHSMLVSRTGEQQRNFPQAFTHLGLVSAAFNLDRALG